MRQDEVEIGGVYTVRWHDGNIVHVEILGTRRHPTYTGRGPLVQIGSKTRYSAKNLKTGRIVTIKSAAKLRTRVS